MACPIPQGGHNERRPWMWTVAAHTGVLIAQVGWLGQRVGGRLALAFII